MKKSEWNKTAKDYYNETLSPIKDSLSSPLHSDLKRLRSKSKTVIDLGCGLGKLSPILSKNFKSVTAIDFSKEMIKKAKQKNNFPNVNYEIANLANLRKYKNKFNIALSINSLLTPNINKINKQLKQIYSVLKPGGTFIAILPAMEIYIYQAQLLKQNNKSQKLKSYTNKKEFNFPLGIINFEGKQKAFYRFEIPWRFQKAGFKNIHIKKVLYSWKTFQQAGQTYFPSEPLPWDWYVICEK
jgi:ubiquinone/menaquinone biosynthesis C-methylase UbiE